MKLDIHRIIIALSFFVMALMNMIGKIKIGDYEVWNMSFGALMLSISSCFEGDFIVSKYKVNLWKFIKYTFVGLGYFFIIAVPYTKELESIIELKAALDETTVLFLALGCALTAIIITDIIKARESYKAEQNNLRLSNMLDRQNKILEKIKKLNYQEQINNNEKERFDEKKH